VAATVVTRGVVLLDRKCSPSRRRVRGDLRAKGWPRRASRRRSANAGSRQRVRVSEPVTTMLPRRAAARMRHGYGGTPQCCFHTAIDRVVPLPPTGMLSSALPVSVSCRRQRSLFDIRSSRDRQRLTVDRAGGALIEIDVCEADVTAAAFDSCRAAVVSVSVRGCQARVVETRWCRHSAYSSCCSIDQLQGLCAERAGISRHMIGDHEPASRPGSAAAKLLAVEGLARRECPAPASDETGLKTLLWFRREEIRVMVRSSMRASVMPRMSRTFSRRMLSVALKCSVTELPVLLSGIARCPE